YPLSPSTRLVPPPYATPNEMPLSHERRIQLIRTSSMCPRRSSATVAENQLKPLPHLTAGSRITQLAYKSGNRLRISNLRVTDRDDCHRTSPNHCSRVPLNAPHQARRAPARTHAVVTSSDGARRRLHAVVGPCRQLP